MRELKFRVYIPDHDKFCYFTLGNFDYSDRYLHQHQYPVQQYTGLKDKSGKEIYEGDILKLKDIIEEIRYEDDSGGYIFLDDFASLFVNNATIVGNIFDNPELLK